MNPLATIRMNPLVSSPRNLSYPSDLTEAQWQLIRPLVLETRQGRRRPTISPRDVVNAIFYKVRTDCPWRMLPHDFPPWGTVHYYYWHWRRNGTWGHIQTVLRCHSRRRGRVKRGEVEAQPVPSAQGALEE